METEQLKTLIVQLAAVVERLDQRSESAVQRVEQSSIALDRSAQHLGSSASGFSREVAQALQQQSADIIGKGLSGAVEQFNRQLGHTARLATAAADEFEQQRKALNRERKAWLWLGCGALLIGSLLSIGTAIYAVKQSRQELAGNRVEATLLHAYNRADVTLCDGALCANIDSKGPRYGDTKQYRPVKPR